VTRIALFCCCALAAAIGTASIAQQGASIREAVEAAWSKSVQLPAASGRLGIARANQTAAQAYWAAAPTVELMNRGDPLTSSTAGQRETEIGVAWPLLLPGQRSARLGSADSELNASEAGVRAAKLGIAGEVREAAWAIFALQAELALAESRARSMQELAADVDRRVAAGDLARADALAARAEALAASNSARETAPKLEAARSRWRVLTGMTDVPVAPEAQANAALEDHPELALARLRTEAAQKRLELTRATRREPPELVVRYRNEVAASGFPSQNSLGLALRIPLATDDRNLPREASSIAEVDVALAEERRSRERLAAELASARALAAAAEQQLAQEESRAVLLRERAQLIDRSFRAGETPLPELLRTLDVAAQAEARLARQRAEFGLARARAQQAAGVLP
jgi:cobalt-zinc-cadmium efflux system outer membrane protein